MYCTEHGYRDDAEFEDAEVFSSDRAGYSREWVHQRTHTVAARAVREVARGVYRETAERRTTPYQLVTPDGFSHVTADREVE